MTVYNKVTLDNEVLIDLSSDTVSSASHIMSGYVGHLNDGTQVTGTGGGSSPTLQTKTVNPTESSQTVVADSGYDGLSSVSVSAVSSSYVGSQVPTQSAQTIHPSPSDQTIASGKYLTGTQTIKGILLTNLSANNIVSGVTVKVGDSDDDDSVISVTGSASGGSANLGTKAITANGTYDAEDDSLDGYSEVTVNVPGYTLDNLAMRSSISGDIVLPTATRIAPYTFVNCTGITSFSAPNVVRFTDKQDSNTNGNGSYIFSGCTSLVSVNMPALIGVGSGGYQFYNCTSLTSIHVPSIPGQHMMEGCTALQTAVFKNQGAWNGYGLQNCTNLTKLDGKPTKIHTSEFNKASKLTTIVLRTSTVPTLSNINAFANTPFANGGTGGTIYIPKTLYDHLGDGSSSDYKAASNWSTVNGYGTITWAKIEGSQYETQYVDGVSIS